MTCIHCTLQSSVEYEYFKERFSVSCAASFSKVSILAAVEWLLALPQGLHYMLAELSGCGCSNASQEQFRPVAKLFAGLHR